MRRLRDRVRAPHAVQIRIRVAGGDLESSGHRIVIFVDGNEWLRSADSPLEIFAPGPWAPGFHTVAASLLVSEIEHGQVVNRAGQGQGLAFASSTFLVLDPSRAALTNMSCAGELAAEGRAAAEDVPGGAAQSAGAGGAIAPGRAAAGRAGAPPGKWQHMRECLQGFVRRFPRSAGALMQLASLDAAHGQWRAAVEGYTRTAALDAA